LPNSPPPPLRLSSIRFLTAGGRSNPRAVRFNVDLSNFILNYCLDCRSKCYFIWLILFISLCPENVSTELQEPRRSPSPALSVSLFDLFTSCNANRVCMTSMLGRLPTVYYLNYSVGIYYWIYIIHFAVMYDCVTWFIALWNTVIWPLFIVSMNRFLPFVVRHIFALDSFICMTWQ
jgi:hypothetical protein